MIIVSALLSLPTLLSLPEGVDPGLLPLFAAAVVIALAGTTLPWDRWHRRWLLAWPVLLMLGVAVAGAFSDKNSLQTLTGLLVIAFFYIGLTQPQGTAVAFVPLALLCWIACYGGWSHVTALRWPIAIGVWLIVSEPLCRLRSEVARLTGILDRQVATDSLTGVGSRRSLDGWLLEPTVGDAVVFLDLDHFKSVNDRHGHAAGDQVLANFGKVLRSASRSQDRAVRFGGEEFVLVLIGAGVEGATRCLERIRDRWAQLEPDVTFSAGIAVVADAAGAQDAITAADGALYQAKAAGRNCWRSVPAVAEPTQPEGTAPVQALDVAGLADVPGLVATAGVVGESMLAASAGLVGAAGLVIAAQPAPVDPLQSGR
jgi:diguanylate cyclase (GGDEF)-like protein